MSRIGNTAIELPAGVTLTIEGSSIIVKSAKGELREVLQPGITLVTEGTQVHVKRAGDDKQTRAFHGLVRSLVANMIKGVTEGYEKRLEMVGTGYRAALQGTNLVLSVGFSHPVTIPQPEGIQFKLEGNNKIIITGMSKYAVGQIAANIRKVRPPEPYKGKGIKYQDEVIRRKAGKAVKAAA